MNQNILFRIRGSTNKNSQDVSRGVYSKDFGGPMSPWQLLGMTLQNRFNLPISFRYLWRLCLSLMFGNNRKPSLRNLQQANGLLRLLFQKLFYRVFNPITLIFDKMVKTLQHLLQDLLGDLAILWTLTLWG